jgi:2-methylcitrate dehydratase PrpD
MASLSQSMASFIARLDTAHMPPEVVEKARVCLLNACGMGLNSPDTPYAPVARAAALAMDGEQRDGATLLGDGRKTSIGGACLANTALFHGRTQEDTCGAAHFGTILIPLLTALIERRGYPIDRLVPALVAGYEAGGLLEQAFAGSTTPAGLRSTALYGAVAAAAAAGKLMALDEQSLSAALANAASFSGGLLQSFAEGTDEWRYQVGVVGRAGWLAAELAKAGSVSGAQAFEGKAGFARVFARSDCDADALAAGLGRDWAILRVTFKPFPVCAFNQTPVTAALALREKLGGAGLRAVRVRMNPYETGYAGMDAVGPFDSVSGTLMSIPFCIAATLLYGVPDMKRMTTYDDPKVNELIGRIRLITDAEVRTLSAVIEVDTADGRTVLAEPADDGQGLCLRPRHRLEADPHRALWSGRRRGRRRQADGARRAETLRGARQCGVVLGRASAVLRRRHRRVALPGWRRRQGGVARRRARQGRIGFGSAGVRGQSRIRPRLCPQRLRRRCAGRRPGPRLGDLARHLQTVPGMRLQPDDGRKTSIGGACLANAALFHGRTQEDTCGAAHFGTILIPLLTALIERRGYPIDRLVPALVAGYEAGGLLEQALAGSTTPAGLRSTWG